MNIPFALVGATRRLVRSLRPVVLLLPLAAWAALQPERLRCEYLDHPIGLDEPQPRLSWIDTATTRGARQTAYRILVATSETNLQAHRGDLWDSGRVNSNETTPIVYAGAPLGSAVRAWWKVQVWDADGAASDWSQPAAFEMGLLAPADWHAQWIAREVASAKSLSADTPLPLLRREFSIDGKIRAARLYVCGLGYHELSLNGRRIGDHLLDPGYTRYDRRVLYVTHDVTAALRSGANALGVMLGNGWFNVVTKAAWDFDRAPWRATPRLLLELRIELEDGRTMIIASDENWKTADGPITFSSIYGGENHDARRELPGWDAAGFDDRGWQRALLVDAPKGKLVAQAMPAIKLDRVIKPIAVTEPAPGVFVFDAGQNLTGDAELALAAPAGTKLTLRYSEKLTPAGRADQSNIDVHVRRFGREQQFQTDHYTFRGDDRGERWHSRFNYNGFRYVEVTGAPGKLTAENLAVRYFHSAAPEVGRFECSNPILNRVWLNGRWSYFSNLFGIPTDCPHREKNGWTGDGQVACEQGLFYADGITIYQKWINDLADEQFITGALPGIVPTSGQWGYGFGSGPAWDSAFLLVPWHLYEYYGDARALKRNYDGFKKYVDYLTSRAHSGIVKIGLGDWSPWKTRTPEEVTDTGYYYRDARIVAAVARMLGRNDEARKYDALADSIRAAFTQAFYHAESATYSQGSQTALGAALYQGLVDPANEPRVTDSLVAAIAKTDHHLDFGLLGSKYVLNALTAHGRADIAYAVASQRTQPGWGWWVEQGATTLLEGWTLGESNNHTFLGDVNAWMMKALAGINADPASPGFKHITIAPHPVGDLTSARGSYDSVRGKIVSEWTKRDGEFRLAVTIPANCTATVELPTNDAAKITESGKPLASAGGITLVRPANGGTSVTIGSGDYQFVVR